ncbi:MAG: ankyrin repeat domain-containing protein, partial [Wolbachia endosymbiont of Homalodisca vitripennis]|nr:ankyrin repeat domain-containing protein [Wolbachia endosymbiont of Homalodisca vitripennis]
GADINAKDNTFSRTPLHDAVIKGHLEIVKYLIEKGTDVDIRDGWNNSSLQHAASNSHLDIVKYLVEKGADLMDKNNTGNTLLHFATGNPNNREGRLEVVKYLIEKGADLNARNDYGDTPLHYAIRAGYLDIAKYLVEKGADVNAKNSNGNTVLYSAAKGYKRSYGQADKQGYLNLVKLLVEKGANLKGALLFVGYGDVFEYLKGLGASYYRKRRSIGESQPERSSLISDRVVNLIKGPTTELSNLLTSREHDNTTVTAIPEINTTVVNNTIMLGILTAGLFNKTQYKQPIHENLLSPREQSMRLNNIDENMIIRAIQQGEEKFGDPKTEMDEVKISGNKTGIWRGFF